MITGMFGAGLLSSFALGPASFSIIYQLVEENEWPWSHIMGFWCADLIYISLAAGFLQSSLLHNPWLETALTVMTVATLWIFALRVLCRSQQKTIKPPTSPLHSGFFQSFRLTLGNFHLVLFYAGLFVSLSVPASGRHFTLGILFYVLGFVCGFIGLLAGLKRFGIYLKNSLRKIEIFAACGFLGFSFYLLMGIL